MKKYNLLYILFILLLLFSIFLIHKHYNSLEPFFGLGGTATVACLPGCAEPSIYNEQQCKPIPNSKSYYECPFTCKPYTISLDPELQKIYKDKQNQICKNDSDCKTCYPYKILIKTSTTNSNTNTTSTTTNNTSTNSS